MPLRLHTVKKTDAISTMMLHDVGVLKADVMSEGHFWLMKFVFSHRRTVQGCCACVNGFGRCNRWVYEPGVLRLFLLLETLRKYCPLKYLFSTVTIDYEVSLIRLLLCFSCTPWLSSCWTKCRRFVSQVFHPVSTLCFTLFWIKITDSNFESCKATVAESKNEEMKLNEAVSAALYVRQQKQTSLTNTVSDVLPSLACWLLFLTCISYWGREAFFQVGVCFPVTMATNLWGSRVPL